MWSSPELTILPLNLSMIMTWKAFSVVKTTENSIDTVGRLHNTHAIFGIGRQLKYPIFLLFSFYCHITNLSEFCFSNFHFISIYIRNASKSGVWKLYIWYQILYPIPDFCLIPAYDVLQTVAGGGGDMIVSGKLQRIKINRY